ncbi:hypothetical protein BS47DRAFT_1363224 [Hydnum rufescens UP504]|uniref:Uncharacterized protein n=1 Tax=Hydnum rufescens UP504 TaxID=1448309 RepID=A0A9P6DV57_9AGAM|nr:hypothetical protein BS47DRAFT_1363224 [Hydnum rufescens UP504]
MSRQGPGRNTGARTATPWTIATYMPMQQIRCHTRFGGCGTLNRAQGKTREHMQPPETPPLAYISMKEMQCHTPASVLSLWENSPNKDTDEPPIRNLMRSHPTPKPRVTHQMKTGEWRPPDEAPPNETHQTNPHRLTTQQMGTSQPHAATRDQANHTRCSGCVVIYNIITGATTHKSKAQQMRMSRTDTGQTRPETTQPTKQILPTPTRQRTRTEQNPHRWTVKNHTCFGRCGEFLSFSSTHNPYPLPKPARTKHVTPLNETLNCRPKTCDPAN